MKTTEEYYGFLNLIRQQNPGKFLFSHEWVKEKMPYLYEDAQHYFDLWNDERPKQDKTSFEEGMFVFSLQEKEISVEWLKNDSDNEGILLIVEDYESIEAGKPNALRHLLNEVAWLISRR